MVPLLLVLCGLVQAQAQLAFDVASVRPSAAEVKYERNGMVKVDHGTLTMHDVTVTTCIHWAYGTSYPLITGPKEIGRAHYDIVAKTDPATTLPQMRLMLQDLLRDRFKLAFHREKKEARVYSMTVAKGGIRMTPSQPGGESFHQNSHTGMIGRSMTMEELADYLADALGAPLTDATGLPGRYDLKIDFTPYADQRQDDIRPDPVAILSAAAKGELGLELVRGRQEVEYLIVDHVEAPTPN